MLRRNVMLSGALIALFVLAVMVAVVVARPSAGDQG